MSPTAESAGAAAGIETAAEALLGEGEVILLAIKPSRWFVVLVSWPVLVAAVGAVFAAVATERITSIDLPGQTIGSVCLVGVALRLFVACAQWVGRLYILTSRRVLTIRGVLRVSLSDLPLKLIEGTAPMSTTGERVLGVGSLAFEQERGVAPDTTWLHLSRAAEVRQAVDDAIRRSQ